MKKNILFPNAEKNSSINSIAAGKMLLDIFVFIIPMFKFIEIRIGGRLFLSEIILFILFMVMLATKNIRLDTKMCRMLIILCVVWLYGQVLTDLIRNTKLIDYSRGWAKIFFTIINFAAIYTLLGNRKRLIIIFAAGFAAGGILEFYLNPGGYAHVYPWKFGIGSSITWLFILAAEGFFAKRFLLCIVLVAIISSLNLIMGFRSLSGICFLAVVYLTLRWFWAAKMSSKLQLSSKSIIILTAILFLSSACFIRGYGYLASTGILGESARQVYEEQAYGMLGLLIGGRSEILISWRAIIDSPVIGHGSWAKDEKYADEFIDIRRLLGYSAIVEDETGLIPTHSHIMGAWVEAGVFGVIFWVWVLFLPIRCLIKHYGTEDSLTPIFVYICFLLIWDILFSPYSADKRFITPYYVVSLMTMLQRTDKEKYLWHR